MEKIDQECISCNLKNNGVIRQSELFWHYAVISSPDENYFSGIVY